MNTFSANNTINKICLLAQSKDLQSAAEKTTLTIGEQSFIAGLLFEYLREKQIPVKKTDSVAETVLIPYEKQLPRNKRSPKNIHIVYLLLHEHTPDAVDDAYFWLGVDYRPKSWYSSQRAWKRRNKMESHSFYLSTSLVNDFKACCTKEDVSYTSVVSEFLQGYINEHS